MKTELEQKQELFVKMIEEIDFDGNVLYFPDGEIEVLNKHNHILENKFYPELLVKIHKLVDMINNDPSLLDKDVETELFFMV